MANNYEIDYNDERFQKVESEKQTALDQVDKTYGDMIGKADQYYNQQIAEAERWGDEQSKLQQEQTDFTLQKIEQQKEQTQKDYLKEQSGAYVDWQKQSAQHGVKAEQMAATGMQNGGYSESAQVSMYNTYQNRVMTARAAVEQAMTSYNNDMTAARLQNSTILAEIAANTLAKKLELSLQGFQYNNQLILEQANKKLEVENNYYSRWQDVLNQINTENSLAEQIRQYNESLAEEQRQFNVLHSGSSGSGGGSGGSGGGNGYYTSSKAGQGTKTMTPAKASAKANSAMEASVARLGYGPLTPQALAEKTASGAVVEAIDANGNLIVKRAGGTAAALAPAQALLDKYTIMNR